MAWTEHVCLRNTIDANIHTLRNFFQNADTYLGILEDVDMQRRVFRLSFFPKALSINIERGFGKRPLPKALSIYTKRNYLIHIGISICTERVSGRHVTEEVFDMYTIKFLRV